MKVREILRRLAEDGWQQVRQRGSHRQFQHPTKPGTVIVAGNLATIFIPKPQRLSSSKPDSKPEAAQCAI